MAKLGHNGGPQLTPEELAENRGEPLGANRRSFLIGGVIVAAVAAFGTYDVFLDGNLYTEIEYFGFKTSTENLMSSAGYSPLGKTQYLQNEIANLRQDINFSEKWLNGRGDFELTRAEADHLKHDLKEYRKQLQMYERLLRKY